MRGQLDLSGHKLAGVFRPNARASRKSKPEKLPDEIYKQLWRLTDGAVRDCFACHPEYLTISGRRHAVRSVTKRVVGLLHGYATQVAQGRSETRANVAGGEAADRAVVCEDGTAHARCFTRSAAWMVRQYAILRRRVDSSRAAKNFRWPR